MQSLQVLLDLLRIAHAKALLDIGATTILTDINEVELRSAVKTLRKNFQMETFICILWINFRIQYL